jgi:hypothetical protein
MRQQVYHTNKEIDLFYHLKWVIVIIGFVLLAFLTYPIIYPNKPFELTSGLSAAIIVGSTLIIYQLGSKNTKTILIDTENSCLEINYYIFVKLYVKRIEQTNFWI